MTDSHCVPPAPDDMVQALLREAETRICAATDELRTTRDELHRVKTEQVTVVQKLKRANLALQNDIAQLQHSNAGLNNLYASMQLPAIVLHSDGRIAQYTPAVTEVFQVCTGDLNRSLAEVTPRFHLDNLLLIVGRVQQTRTPYDVVVRRAEPEAWWLMRIQPYHIPGDRIDGVVITFTDVSVLKRIEVDREHVLQGIQAARVYAEQIIAAMAEPLLILDGDLRVQLANPAYYETFLAKRATTETRLLYDLDEGIWHDVALRAQLTALQRGQIDRAVLELTMLSAGNTTRTFRLQARPIMGIPERPPLILLAIADITELTQAAMVLEDARTTLERRVNERTRELAVLNTTLQQEIAQHRRSERARLMLLQQLMTAQEEERRRVARELHDQLGQDLAGLILGLQVLRNTVAIDTPAVEQVHQLQALAMQIGLEVRTLAVQLRPAVLDDLGLGVALGTYVEQWSNRARVAIDLHTAGLDGERLQLAFESTI